MQASETTHHHILLVEDEPELLDLIAETLRDFGFDVTASPVSSDALRLFTEKPEGFDLVISDQNMPGMAGAELMSAIRRIRHDIPLMLMTGDCEQSFGALSDSKVRVLGKPFDDQELVKEIRTLLH